MGYARRDQNFITTATAVSSVDGITPVELWADPTTHRLLVDASVGSSVVFPTAGTVGGGNKVFTFATAPVIIVVDQQRTMQKVNSAPDSNVNWTGTTTITLQVAPTFDIFAFT